jgi:two-component system, OmpR family, sensor histidine kinase KdpD
VIEPTRPDPDALLRLAEREESPTGKLKIFFGMAAGVGKTYAMLREAHALQQEGADVVIGYLEAHQRRQTQELASGLETMPRRKLEYRGRAVEEMDVDALLTRRPGLALVDELAHTNAPGSRNRKRWQDVMELIGQGLNVATTVNVQHLESVADTVEDITGVTVAERVPDSVFDAAAEVVLIDLSPEELLKRLSEGRVYTGDMARAAMENFFKRSTLTALRELALRHTALMVNHQLSDLASSPHGSGRLLVAISPSPNSAHLLRWTRQRAFSRKAAWTALHVDTGRALVEEERALLGRNMDLARQLGGEVVSVPSDNVPEAVIRYARSAGVTEIVVGKSGFMAGAPLLRRRTIAERILKMSGGIDVAVVQEKGREKDRAPFRPGSYLRPGRGSWVKALAAIAVVTGMNLLALPMIGYRSASILYLLAIIALSFTIGRAALITAAAVSAVLWNFFFLPPRFTFLITKLEDILMFFLYFVTAAALAYLMSRLRANQKMLRARERRLSLQVGLSQALSVTRDTDGIVHTGLSYTAEHFSARVFVLLRDESGGLERTPRALEPAEVDEKEFGVARWCFDRRAPCGRYTDTLHMAGYHYIPLLTPDSVIGVFAIRLEEGKAWLPEQEESLQTVCRLLSLSLERELLSEQNRKNLMARESERLGRILLNSISHELRTPLTTIKGSITALMDEATGADPESRGILLGETLTASERLNGIVENLLNMNRLESGVLRLRRATADVVDLTSVVADALRRQTRDHPFTIAVDENVPPISVDFVLLVQVLSNLVQNAVHHTPAGTPITLSVERTGRDIRFCVSDQGPGVAVEELPRLFETFFRGRRAGSGGVGIGLSICKGIVEAHGGRISAALNKWGGLAVSILLPEASA